MTVRKVCILGASLNTGNMGVSALAASLVALIRDVEPEAEISFFMGCRTTQPEKIVLAGKTLEIKIINYRLSPRASIGEHLVWLFLASLAYSIAPFVSWKKAILRSNWRLNALKRADFVGNICGGDSFSDIYGLSRFLNGVAASLIILLLGNKLHMLPQTYGPYRTRISQFLAGVILERSAGVLARDREGLDVVRHLLRNMNKHKDLQFCPDVAFALEAAPPDLRAIHPPLQEIGQRNLVGFNINGLLYNGGYTRNNMFGLALDYRRFVHETAGKLLKQTDCSLLFVPHTFAPDGDVESDPQACREVFDALSEYSNRIHFLQGVHDQHAVKGIIGLCSFFIGSRMHACIAALSQGIPTAAIAYSRKFAGVFDSLEMGDMVIDARDTKADEAEDRLLSLYKERGHIRQVLGSKVAHLRFVLSDAFEKMLRVERPSAGPVHEATLY